jgi:hypothetical protein
LSLATPGFEDACEVATIFISFATGNVTSAALLVKILKRSLRDPYWQSRERNVNWLSAAMYLHPGWSSTGGLASPSERFPKGLGAGQVVMTGR